MSAEALVSGRWTPRSGQDYDVFAACHTLQMSVEGSNVRGTHRVYFVRNGKIEQSVTCSGEIVVQDDQLLEINDGGAGVPWSVAETSTKALGANFTSRFTGDQHGGGSGLMKTNADEIIYITDKTRREAVALAGRDHSPEDYKAFLKDVGASVEVFLKDHVYAGAHNRWNFVQLIDSLEPLGVSADSRDALHALRLAYNKAKHDPNYDAPIRSVTKVLTDAQQALKEIATLGVGTTGQPARVISRRLLWFAAWDHYIGGDTEISIFLPATEDVDFPPDLDIIYTKMEAWDTIKTELAAAGTLCLGPDCIPAKFYNFWQREGDFLNAGSFEGDIRDLIAVFARHERVENVLSFLKRENDRYSMFAAALFAVVDNARQGSLPDDASEVADAIALTASHYYAAPASSKLLRSYAKMIADMLIQCPLQVRTMLSGPVWVTKARFSEMQAEGITKVDDLKLMVMGDGRLVAGI